MPTNPNSILDSTKKLLGFDPEYTAFDVDIIMHINSAFGSLYQLGVGPAAGFFIADNTAMWTDFVPYQVVLNFVKTYIYLKVRMVFDPPSTSFVIDSINRQTEELESRINILIESMVPPSDPLSGTTFSPFWWDLTGLTDFPTDAKVGDFGIDFSNDNFYVNDQGVVPGYAWDLTGLSDFPSEALVGDLGIDLSTGDIWSKQP